MDVGLGTREFASVFHMADQRRGSEPQSRFARRKVIAPAFRPGWASYENLSAPGTVDLFPGATAESRLRDKAREQP